MQCTIYNLQCIINNFAIYNIQYVLYAVNNVFIYLLYTLCTFLHLIFILDNCIMNVGARKCEFFSGIYALCICICLKVCLRASMCIKLCAILYVFV